MPSKPEFSWSLFTLLEAFDWKWPPDVLLRQSETVITDLLAIKALVQKIREDQKENEDG